MLAERLQPRQMLSGEIGPTGEQFGNLPQTITHLALTSAAHTISPGCPR